MYPWLEANFLNLTKRSANGSLHHALILSGLQGIGKKDFSIDLAKYILCQNKKRHEACGVCQSCQLFNAESHPDFHQILSEKQIGVDLIRDAIQKLIGTAQLAGNKALIIFKADTMTEASANALLKTLEEPTSNTYLILVCDKPERLLPTILSRCEKITLHGPDISSCKKWLEENGCQGVSDGLIKLYSNSPLTIVQRLADDKAIDYDEFCHAIRECQEGKIQATDLANKWSDDTVEILNWLKLLVNESIKQQQNDALWALYQQCVESSRIVVNPGINKSLLLAGMLERIRGLNVDLVGVKSVVS